MRGTSPVPTRLRGDGYGAMRCEQHVSIGMSLSSFFTSYAQFRLPKNEANPSNYRQFQRVEILSPAFSPGLSTLSVSNWTRKPYEGRHPAHGHVVSGVRPGPMGCRFPRRPVRVPGLAQLIDGGQQRCDADLVVESMPVFCREVCSGRTFPYPALTSSRRMMSLKSAATISLVTEVAS